MEQAPHLLRYAGQHHGDSRLALQPQAGGRTPSVFHGYGSPGHLSLGTVFFGHGTVSQAGEALAQFFQIFGVEFEGSVEDVCYDLLGDIVARRSQTARGHDETRAIQAVHYGAAYRVAVVGYGSGPGYVNAGRGERGREFCSVGVESEAK